MDLGSFAEDSPKQRRSTKEICNTRIFEDLPTNEGTHNIQIFEQAIRDGARAPDEETGLCYAVTSGLIFQKKKFSRLQQSVTNTKVD